ncbi:hypothetical protein EK21DRAFT_116999 [Setomelanomma holmii]|uniref:Uncharacterized protein n=1 Tax=Setomelanomma holmii TaxID=210430 RepID=A0A9P4H0S5_9PLEO|nr:hypothetical protein EK21DRAFT_116999 [Setomelanomma holmii]
MTCYLRNGSKARHAVPCDHTAILQGKHTACCDPDDQCLTNGLCRDPAVNDITNFVWFFGNTDVTFQDPSSGNYCDKVNTGNNHLIFKCPEQEKWCCNTGDPAPSGASGVYDRSIFGNVDFDQDVDACDAFNCDVYFGDGECDEYDYFYEFIECAAHAIVFEVFTWRGIRDRIGWWRGPSIGIGLVLPLAAAKEVEGSAFKRNHEL